MPGEHPGNDGAWRVTMRRKSTDLPYPGAAAISSDNEARGHVPSGAAGSYERRGYFSPDHLDDFSGSPGICARSRGEDKQALLHLRMVEVERTVAGASGGEQIPAPLGCGPSAHDVAAVFDQMLVAGFPRRPKPKLLIVDELGYLPFDPNATHLFFQLVSRRYERGSLLLTSNRSVGEWGTVFGDGVRTPIGRPFEGMSASGRIRRFRSSDPATTALGRRTKPLSR